jgi:mRNA interferase MazF
MGLLSGAEPRGHEQDGRRPRLVISVDQLGTDPGELAIVVPLTRTHRVPTEIQIDPPESGLEERSGASPYQVRAISRGRLKRRRGTVSPATLTAVIAAVTVTAAANYPPQREHQCAAFLRAAGLHRGR